MQLYPIKDHSWVAVGLIDTKRENFTLAKQNAGSLACRDMLTCMQQQLNLVGKLNDTNFPYYFITANGYTWYVSFSHSRQHAAVLISPYTNIGIDVEDSAISHQVASRFFSPHEYQWVNQKPTVNQAVLRNLLWRLKECAIKTHQNADKQLIKELKHDVLDELGEEVINQLIGVNEISAKDKAKDETIQYVQTDAKIVGNFSNKPCSFIIVNS